MRCRKSERPYREKTFSMGEPKVDQQALALAAPGKMTRRGKSWLPEMKLIDLKSCFDRTGTAGNLTPDAPAALAISLGATLFVRCRLGRFPALLGEPGRMIILGHREGGFGAGQGRVSGRNGKVTQKVVPRPGSVSKCMTPPCLRVTMA